MPTLVEIGPSNTSHILCIYIYYVYIYTMYIYIYSSYDKRIQQKQSAQYRRHRAITVKVTLTSAHCTTCEFKCNFKYVYVYIYNTAVLIKICRF